MPLHLIPVVVVRVEPEYPAITDPWLLPTVTNNGSSGFAMHLRLYKANQIASESDDGKNGNDETQHGGLSIFGPPY